ncbi:MAG TPA: hypothetical protein VEK84_18095 [Terriglobales bacterium]|nr:hypothetical protein [Terriglobales bacterium]
MTNKRLTRRRFLVTNVGALMAGAFLRSSLSGQQPTNDPGAAYRSGRRSLFQLSPPPGKPLPTKTTDTGIRVSGDRAERMLTHIAEAPGLKRGELVLCAEYGRIEIMDSDDDQIRLQIRLESNAGKAIEDTQIRAHLTSDAEDFNVRVWHETQGFGRSVRPCDVGIRLQVPSFGSYKIDAIANHGCVGVHRLTLASCKLRGLVGIKVQQVKGYQGGHDLNNVIVSGDLDVATDAPQGFGNAWIHGTMRVVSSCKVTARTNEGSIRLSFSLEPETGIDVIGRSDEGKVLLIGIAEDPRTLKSGSEAHRRSEGFEGKRIQVAVHATSSRSDVTIVSPI